MEVTQTFFDKLVERKVELTVPCCVHSSDISGLLQALLEVIDRRWDAVGICWRLKRAVGALEVWHPTIANKMPGHSPEVYTV